MKMCSLFDGSGGFPLAGAMCGIEPVYASEVEPYPIAVTRSRFPDMIHIGDVSKVSGADIEPVDVITFGSPCQDLSVAGKRAGLKHEEKGDEETTRSGLFMEAIRIIKEMREATNGKYPTFALWENVPGAFSSNKGDDFRVVLEEFIKIKEPSVTMPPADKNGWPYADVYVGDGWSLAYRTFDAQFWGVPQRRRRIYLVADFRGDRAGKILFEREGLRRDFKTGREKRQKTPPDAEDGSGAADSEAESDMTPSTPQNHDHETPPSYLLKIRGGVEIDSYGKKAGKGPLIQKERSATLGVSQDQYLFQPKSHILIDSIGGQSERAWETDIAPTLKATHYKSPPTIMLAAGFKPGQGAKAQGMGWEMEKALTLLAGQEPGVCVAFEPGVASRCGGHVYDGVSGTLRATPGDNQMTVAYSVENHPNDSRVKIDETGKVQALTGRMGTGGGNVPMVMEPFSKSRRAQSKDDFKTWVKGKTANTLNTFDNGDVRATTIVVCDMGGGKSQCNISENKTPTLTCTHGGEPVVCFQQNQRDEVRTMKKAGAITAQPGMKNQNFVCYGMSSMASNAMLSDNPNSGIYETKTSKTLDLNGGNPACNQGGIMIVMATQQGGAEIAENLCPTIRPGAGPNGTANVAVCYWDGGQTTGTLTANNAGGSQRMPDKDNFNCVIEENAMESQYIVRRLTPMECCRLQGFPDGWGEIDPKEDFTDEEYKFWYEVRNTHAAISGRKPQAYTKQQLLTWYNKLHTDSAEYKMWGNGISLPTALYVMEGIAEALQDQEQNN